MKRAENSKYIPVKMFIRVSRKESETAERALLVAEDERGKKYVFTYKDAADYLQHLVIEDYTFDN